MDYCGISLVLPVHCVCFRLVAACVLLQHSVPSTSSQVADICFGFFAVLSSSLTSNISLFYKRNTWSFSSLFRIM
ncbi:hypothetical protein NDU88_004144 [Pleurodeles waltl]|uniref:Secreted protein n=1 Tax=Pleurodeles waltl TaxID=8319 RepID=A0AAV7SHX8_PLEWA|nr:hypothetical protein NDU88_004144 [Pleurodeles waltl]